MKVNVVKQENNMVQLDIEVDAELAAQEYNKACKKLGERITVPGFRKGKAPRAMVESYVGVDEIRRQALDRLLPNVFADTISEHQYDLASEPIIESFKYELGEPLKVIAKLELKPEVKLNNYKGLTVEVPEFKHPEDAVEQELKALSERFATLEPIVNRPAEPNDIVNIDYSGTIEGEPIKGGSAKNHQLDLAHSSFIKGFAEQIVGKKIGEEFTINVNFPEDYHEPALVGKPAEFQVKVNEIKEKHIPAIDDELAQKVGPFQTIEELKTDLASFLEKSKNNENKVRAERVVLDKVIEQAQVETPDSMINREARVLMEEVQAKLKSQGISWEQVLDTQGQENIWNSLREEAAKRVKNSLVLGAVAKTENIHPSDEDFLAKVRELATVYNTDEQTVFQQISKNPGLAQGISHQIMTQKVVQFLLDNNEVKYIEEKSSTPSEQ
ncbi:MAG: trigger factor [Candidatus Melainabacteria bacterium RIFOXYA12_FULL_32_12]|nr:MAG: trigger factor [Candidatus Melainabacteria bacterium RIFOXYA2_FULL_32_9]OGI24805.1 MAG: trigger factor [Candidatus Melainabacteria bacterium RIFOXYA12_FULL_32_12]